MEKIIHGRCFCGNSTWNAELPILWAGFCHCEDCRKAASADYVSWFAVHRKSVSWFGSRVMYHSSESAERSFCGDCGAPLSYESTLVDETHLYAVTLDKVELYKPEAHFYYSKRLPWVEVKDNLAKCENGS